MSTHGDYEVDVFNAQGEFRGRKLRKDIDKQSDVIRAVYIFVLTPGKKLALALIAQHPVYKRLYPEKWGCTCSTVVRSHEPHHLSAIRTIEIDLFVHNPELTFLGEHFEMYSDGVWRWAAVYWYRCLTNEIIHNPVEIRQVKMVDRAGLEQLLREKPEDIAPSFTAHWARYARQLPF